MPRSGPAPNCAKPFIEATHTAAAAASPAACSSGTSCTVTTAKTKPLSDITSAKSAIATTRMLLHSTETRTTMLVVEDVHWIDDATLALLRHLEHVTGVPTSHAELGDAVGDWEVRLDTAVAEDDEARAYLPQLEAHYDREAEDQIPSPDDLAEDFERFLRDARDDDS